MKTRIVVIRLNDNAQDDPAALGWAVNCAADQIADGKREGSTTENKWVTGEWELY